MVSFRTELAAHGIRPQKRLGQHFLVDRNILNKVVRAARVEKDDLVLEVGPGLGGMTEILARHAGRVIAIEFDPKLAQVLREKLATLPNMEVIQEDILEFDFNALVRDQDARIKVVANLPYQISTPLLFRFIESRHLFSTLTLMLQKEVAQRMVAGPGGKDYGPLSISLQAVADATICFYVNPSSFFPPPNVDSAVISITWKKIPLIKHEDEEGFRQVVRRCLGYRRKTLGNALKHAGFDLSESLLKRLEHQGIDLQRRPDTLKVKEFVFLFKILTS